MEEGERVGKKGRVGDSGEERERVGDSGEERGESGDSGEERERVGDSGEERICITDLHRRVKKRFKLCSLDFRDSGDGFH